MPDPRSAPVVAVLLESPFDDAVVAGRSVRRLAEEALAGLTVVLREEAPRDAILVVHDPACPVVPPRFVAELIDRCSSTGLAQVPVLAVTDTVKLTVGPAVGETLDRDALAVVASPLVLPAGVRAEGSDMVSLLDQLRSSHEVDLVEAPREALRLIDARDLAFVAR